MVVPSTVLDEELVRKRRAELVAAATGLFLSKGFHKTTVRDIATAAGWQMGTLYRYTSRKEDVLYLISQAIMEQLSSGILAVPPQADAASTLRTALENLYTRVNSMRREMKLLYRESASLLPEHLELLQRSELDVRDFFANIIRDGIQRGEFREANADVMAYDMIMLAHMWVLKGWALFESTTFEDYMQERIDFFMTQLSAAPASSDGSDSQP